jgi:hypothetical protein
MQIALWRRAGRICRLVTGNTYPKPNGGSLGRIFNLQPLPHVFAYGNPRGWRLLQYCNRVDGVTDLSFLLCDHLLLNNRTLLGVAPAVPAVYSRGPCPRTSARVGNGTRIHSLRTRPCNPRQALCQHGAEEGENGTCDAFSAGTLQNCDIGSSA